MLFLLHHAQAADPLIDPQRPLTAEGRTHAEAIARRAKQRGLEADVVWHSGKLRAKQTAEALWRTCCPLAAFAAARGLQPDDPPEWIRDVVSADPRQVVLVGHLPHLPRLYRLLVGEDTTEAAREFPTHGLIALERGAAGWAEVWRETGG